jgi:hypothetical protein
MRFEIITMMINIAVVWDVTPWILVERYSVLEEPAVSICRVGR